MVKVSEGRVGRDASLAQRRQRERERERVTGALSALSDLLVLA